MRVLERREVVSVGGGDTDYGPIVACTLLGTVGIAVGAAAGPVGFALAYFAALTACNR